MYSYRYGHDDATLVLVRLGDMNCDEHVNALDIDGFVTAIINFEQYETEYTGCEILRGDINDDGVVNMFDIDGFVELLTAE